MRVVLDYRPALRARSGVGEYVHQTVRAFALQYPGVGGVTIEKAAALEEAAAARVVRRLAVEVREGTLGRCRSCGRTCPPWFPLCERCARSGRR